MNIVERFGGVLILWSEELSIHVPVTTPDTMKQAPQRTFQTPHQHQDEV